MKTTVVAVANAVTKDLPSDSGPTGTQLLNDLTFSPIAGSSFVDVS